MEQLETIKHKNKQEKYLVFKNIDIYTVGHKKRATFIFTITLANVDRFQ